MDNVITLDHVSKVFKLSRSRPRSFLELLASLGRKGREPRRDEFGALQDVSFEVERGSTVGFVGPNGAGKSTILKLIARILEPDAGTISVHGRVGALLELGAGFHPDLTGRENIYLNASIMGLHRRDVDRRLDDIVAFSELERFIDVPVKHYSSGMYVRLGFAVAVHTDPEILLVDEVLAVGDASFQRKCFERIAEMSRGGLTIVLVSHDLGMIQAFCDRALWLDEGCLRKDGQARDVVAAYVSHIAALDMAKATADRPERGDVQRWGTGRIRFTRVAICGADGRPRTAVETGETVEVCLHYETSEAVMEPVFGLGIHHQNGVHLCGPNTQLSGLVIPQVQGRGIVRYRIPQLNLLEGTYLLSVSAVNKTNTEVFDYHDRLYLLRVHRGRCSELHGMVTMNGQWEVAL